MLGAVPIRRCPVDDVQPRPLAAVVGEYRPAPASRNQSLLQGGVAVSWLVLALLQALLGATLLAVIWSVLSLGYAFGVYRQRHPLAATGIGSEGVRVRRWTGRWRELPWDAITEVRPAGRWSDVARARLVDGSEVDLRGVPEHAAQALAAHVQPLREAAR